MTASSAVTPKVTGIKLYPKNLTNNLTLNSQNFSPVRTTSNSSNRFIPLSSPLEKQTNRTTTHLKSSSSKGLQSNPVITATITSSEGMLSNLDSQINRTFEFPTNMENHTKPLQNNMNPWTSSNNVRNHIVKARPTTVTSQFIPTIDCTQEVRNRRKVSHLNPYRADLQSVSVQIDSNKRKMGTNGKYVNEVATNVNKMKHGFKSSSKSNNPDVHQIDLVAADEETSDLIIEQRRVETEHTDFYTSENY